MPKDNSHRLNVNMSTEQQKAMKDLIPQGYRTIIFRHLIDAVIRNLKENPGSFMKAIIDDSIEFKYEGR